MKNKPQEKQAHTPGPWIEYRGGLWTADKKIRITAFDDVHIFAEQNGISLMLANEQVIGNRALLTAAPELLEAVKYALKLVSIARQYFPKSIKNSDRFTLENTCATLNKTIVKAEEVVHS